MTRPTEEQDKCFWGVVDAYVRACGGSPDKPPYPDDKSKVAAMINRCVEMMIYPEIKGISDELLEAALKKISDAADLLGWDIHVHTDGNEFCDGIIVGHPDYSEKALGAFEDAEDARKNKKS